MNTEGINRQHHSYSGSVKGSVRRVVLAARPPTAGPQLLTSQAVTQTRVNSQQPLFIHMCHSKPGRQLEQW